MVPRREVLDEVAPGLLVHRRLRLRLQEDRMHVAEPLVVRLVAQLLARAAALAEVVAVLVADDAAAHPV